MNMEKDRGREKRTGMEILEGGRKRSLRSYEMATKWHIELLRDDVETSMLYTTRNRCHLTSDRHSSLRETLNYICLWMLVKLFVLLVVTTEPHRNLHIPGSTRGVTNISTLVHHHRLSS